MTGTQQPKHHMSAAFFLLLLLPTACFAAPATFRVLDGSGAPVKDVLVIVQSLDSAEREVSRELTDEQGRVHAVELKTGTYRAIATTPYGLWETAIKEFLVTEDPVELTLKLQPQPTHGFGDIVPLNSSKAELQVLTREGVPASGAEVLVRDKDDTLYLERWYTTDKKGRSKIELVATPTVLVIIYNGKLLETHLGPTDTHPVIRLPN